MLLFKGKHFCLLHNWDAPFLKLPQLSAKLLWFPLIKRWLKAEYRGNHLNREQRRARPQLTLKSRKYLVVVLDRTQWRDRNLFMVSLIWGTHALPVYWELLPQLGSSSLRQQQKNISAGIEAIKTLSSGGSRRPRISEC